MFFHCNILQHTTTHTTTQTTAHTAIHCHTLKHTVTRCNTPNTLQHTATHRHTTCNTLNTLQHTATHRTKHCNTQMCPRWTPGASFAWIWILIVPLYLVLQLLRRHGGTSLFKSIVNSFVQGKIWDYPSNMTQKWPKNDQNWGVESSYGTNKPPSGQQKSFPWWPPPPPPPPRCVCEGGWYVGVYMSYVNACMCMQCVCVNACMCMQCVQTRGKFKHVENWHSSTFYVQFALCVPSLWVLCHFTGFAWFEINSSARPRLVWGRSQDLSARQLPYPKVHKQSKMDMLARIMYSLLCVCGTCKYQRTNMLQHAATRCSTLQHAAIRCNTLQLV